MEWVGPVVVVLIFFGVPVAWSILREYIAKRAREANQRDDDQRGH